MKLTAEIIEAFAGMYLSGRYDSPQPTPDFHRECWARYCSDHPACATAAPRNHAKSTALTHDYILATACWRIEPYIILVGSSEEMAIEHLGDIRSELQENEELIRDFGIKCFITDQKTDIAVECHDGYKFRIIARGAEQKIRGKKWNGRRPGLVVFDDIEDDEQVENKDRRKKFRRWFFRACKQALRDGGKIRGHGTILHEDSLLNHLMHNRSWDSKLYKAHAGFNDFSNILWEEKFPESRLRAIRQEFTNEGDGPGYSQEYLNDPLDNDDAYLREEQFIPMKDEHFEEFMLKGVGVDFAVSKADTANRTAFVTGGKTLDNQLNHLDYQAGRWDTSEIIDKFFEIQKAFSPDVFFVEDGVIWKTIKPVLDEEMRERDLFLNCEAIMSTKDKAVRGRPFQKRMKSRSCRFNTQHSEYEDFKEELLMFTPDREAIADDFFDAASILSRGFSYWSKPEEEDTYTEEEIEFEQVSARLRGGDGRSSVTGY